MAEDSSKYCTLIDKFGEVSKKNADYKKVFELLADRCMLSLLTKRVTFLLPVGKALKELEKMSAAKQRECVKRHIIGGAFEKAELEGRDRVYTRATIDKSRRVAYLVEGKGANLTIGKVKVGKVAMKVMGKTKAGKDIPVGIAYEIDDLLPEAGEEVPLRPRGSNGKAPKGKRASQAGGNGPSPLEYVVQHEVDHLMNLNGHDLRWAIIEQYKNSWPQTVFGIDSQYSWHNWANASLVSFLAERIPDFYWVYSPYLGLDPFMTLDLLFEYHVQDMYHKYLLEDELIKQWVKSPYFLYSDPVLLTNSSVFLAGGGARSDGQSGGINRVISNIISLNPELSTRYVATGRKAIGEFMRYNNPEKLREGIVKTYKKVYEEPDILLGETRAIYEQVDKEPFVVALQNDLRRFFDERFRYHSEFDLLYPSFLHCNDCRPEKSSFFGLFGGGNNKLSNARWFLKSVLQYDLESLTVDLGDSSRFRFPDYFLNDFVQSKWFLYMPGMANLKFEKPMYDVNEQFRTHYVPPEFSDLEIHVDYEDPVAYDPSKANVLLESPNAPSGSVSMGLGSMGLGVGVMSSPYSGLLGIDVGRSKEDKVYSARVADLADKIARGD